MSGDEPTPDPDRMARVDRALAEYLLAVDARSAPEPVAWLARHPDLQPELGEVLTAELGLRRLADPLRLDPGPAMASGAPTTVAGEHHADPPQASAGGPDETQPASRTSADPGVTTDRVDGGAATVDGRPEDAPAALAGGARVRYFGDYEIRRELGRGGMGVVYEARQLSLNRPVALKMIKAGVLADDNELRRFQNEAEAVALLDHAGIVPVHEVGEHDGQRYFSMKLVQGGSLAGRLDAYRDDPRVAAALLAGVAEAVHHAHMRGILHRDLKPANILLDDRGRPHVTDFGLAKRVEGDSELTQSGAILGTPAYMSPEQASGRREAVTTASDVYGLGAILYALLAGRAPFGGDTVIDTIRQVRERDPEPVSKDNPRTPRDLEVICLKCLQKDPARRYGSAQALADDLHRYLAGEPITARRTGSLERAWLWCRRNPWLAGAIGSTAAAVLAVAMISTVFAVAQTRAKDRISGLAVNLRSSLDRSENLAGDLKTSLRESYRHLARLDFERAQNAFEKEQIGPGLLRLVQSWRSAIAADDPGWQHAARAGIAAWRCKLVEPRIIVFHEQPVGAIAFSPDGKMVLTAGGFEWTAQLWDAADGRPLTPPLRHQGMVECIAISPDARIALTGSWDKTARLWDTATGRPIAPPMHHQDVVRRVAFSPDGKIVVTATSDNTAQLWDATSGRPFGPPLQHPTDGQYGSYFLAVAFSPDGRSVITGSHDDHTARLWDTTTGQLLTSPLRHQESVSAVAFSPDGKAVLTGSHDHTARLWDPATGEPIGAPMHHPDHVLAVAFSPDGKVVLTGGADGMARLWDAATGQPLGLPMPHLGSVNEVAFSPDGKTVLTGSDDHTARLWDVAVGRPIGFPLQLDAQALKVAFSPNGKTVLTLSARMARLWDAATGRPIGAPMQRDRRGYGAVAFSPDGKVVLTGGDDGMARLWDAATGQPIGVPMQHLGGVGWVAFSPDGKAVLTGTRDHTTRLWDAASGRPIGAPMRHQNWVITVAFSPDGRALLLTGSDDYTARLWDAATGRPIGAPMQLQGAVWSVAFSPDGKAVLTGSEDHTARLWDATSGRPIGVPMWHQDRVTAVCFSPDGKMVLTGSDDHTARLWDAATGHRLGPALRHPRHVLSIAFSPDGKTVVTGSRDRTARLWDAATGRPLGPPFPHDDLIQQVAYSPDGGTVLTASSDAARLWSVTDLPDDPERVSAWLSKATALGLDDGDDVRLLDRAALEESRKRLESLGGPPLPKPRGALDPILFGADPAARARAWIQRGCPDRAAAAFDEALRTRPLYAPLWADRARFHASCGHPDQAVEDAAQAALVCWNDPRLAALARSDATFRAEALHEILQMPTLGCRAYPEVWRGLARRRAARGDWAGANRDFAAPETPVVVLFPAELLARACLLRLVGDAKGTDQLALEVRGLLDRLPSDRRGGSTSIFPWVQIPIWFRLLDDPAVDPADLVRTAEGYTTQSQGEAKSVLGAVLLRAGRLDEAVRRFEESLAVEHDWPLSGLNDYGLALAHHRLGHADQARQWFDRAESWLNRLDRTYASEAPGTLTGQPQVAVTFEFWVYAQVLRREAAGPILDAAFPADPFVR
jgi:WD40 repeat protein/serine/threonine protein kinase